MKYLSKEELEDITNELLENPTRETLKVLNNKYNSEENGVETKSIVEPVKIDVPEVPIAPEVKLDIPTFEVPQSVPVQNNNAQVNFSGNLWEPQMPTIGNMMETTDNFNTVQNTMPNTNPNIQNTPFFGQTTEPVNNPIPVNNVPNNGPSMFGQIQQNYNMGA